MSKLGLGRGFFKLDFDWKLKNVPDRVFFYLLAASLLLRIIWLDKPPGSLIFDEKYYVNVARIIVGLPHDPDVYQDAPLGVDPNHEHPPLAKLFIALSVSLLGNNPYGFRLPSVIFGTISIFIFYLLMKKISKRPTLSLIATFLFSFDNLVFVHSRIATLDIFVLAFLLLGFYWYFDKKTVLSAVAFALATLCKVGGLYGVATILAYHFFHNIHLWRSGRERIDWKTRLGWLERFSIVYGVSLLGLLLILDRAWGGYANPIDHIVFIYNYTRALTRDVPAGIESYPWQWLMNQIQIPYLTVNVDVYADKVLTGSYAAVAFVGAMNPLIIYLCIPSMAYMAYTYYEKKDNFALFTLLWFACTYLPFYPMSIFWHRISYIFYFLNTVPAVCIAIAYMLLDQKPPKIVIALYLLAVLAGFYMLFPFKTVPS